MFLLSVIAIIINKKEYIILCIMSLLEFDSGTSPQNVAIYILLFALFVDVIINLNKYRNRKIIILSILSFSFYIVISLINYVKSSGSISEYFLYDIKIFLSVIISMLIFKNINIDRLDKIIRILATSYIIFVSIGYVNDLSSLVVESRSYVGYSIQLTLFLAYFTFSFFKKYRVNDLCYILLLIFLMVVTDNVISQNILILIVSFIICLFTSERKNITFFIGFFIIVIASFFLNSVDIESTRTFDKLNNIVSLFNYSGLMDVSHSPLVRIIEFINILYGIMNFYPFGSGFGGYFSEYIIQFPVLNKYDFSFDQINSGQFYMPHNFNYGLLKYGVVYVLVFAFLFKLVLNLKDENKKSIFIVILLFSSLNFGFTFIPSLLLGVLIANVSEN
ncbi:TPA: hypothetical protein ACX6RZ_002931 [Photobacterium damselae]